jgi:hypothetical protein
MQWSCELLEFANGWNQLVCAGDAPHNMKQSRQPLGSEMLLLLPREHVQVAGSLKHLVIILILAAMTGIAGHAIMNRCCCKEVLFSRG